MTEDFRILIVEDDFRIADITSEFISKLDGFSIVGLTKSGEETLEFLKKNTPLPHIILLDVYIPDVKGLDLFWSIRKTYHQIDIIMVTATKEVTMIEDTLRGGIFDYIVKPVDFSRLKATLDRFKERRTFLDSKSTMDQKEIDMLTGVQESMRHENPSHPKILPKGIDGMTLDKIREILQPLNREGVTAVEVSKKLGASRSTVRRYLEYMTSINELKVKQSYGEVGRPERRYICEQNEQN
ncbi:response regulator [Salipaludibacillus sp. CF4.18]|uniref:response regulator n=1 Tax=Salipaludibacillus sp. CF4.18 TaxID=3373081 RepID=UPI003EE483A9